jgi:anti-sigma B factor antagonist
MANGFRRAVELPLDGELDVAAAHAAYRRLLGLDLRRGDQLVLDLGRLTFMDSSGIRLILQCRDRAQRAGAGLVVIRGSDVVMRVLELVGLDEQLEFVER